MNPASIREIQNSCLSGLTGDELKEARPIVLHDVIQDDVVKDSILESICDGIGHQFQTSITR